MSDIIVGPFNRVEGDLELKLDIQSNQILDAKVTSPMYRGFEQILLGKPPLDALVYTPRICGICSVSQSIACAYALENSQSKTVPHNGRIATNLVLATENILDHLTHFYLFFMPDFAKAEYQSKPWYPTIKNRFQAGKGKALNDILPARADLLKVVALLAGKWPHTLSIQPGGSSKAIDKYEQIELKNTIRQFKLFLEESVFGGSLHTLLEKQTRAELLDWANDNASDFAQFIQLIEVNELEDLGSVDLTLMSYGNYQSAEATAFASGIFHQGKLQPLDADKIKEHTQYSYLNNTCSGKHPLKNTTEMPTALPDEAYSWCKAPRLDGKVIEVGAFARQVIDQQPLIVDLNHHTKSNVANRVIARMIEVARIALLLEQWADEFEIGNPFYQALELPKNFQSEGLIEAARGSLGHWMEVKDGKISNYQIIAPTTWNFSPMDDKKQKGALEQALIGTNAPSSQSVKVEHIVRSFDPCMVCTAH
ncbi:hydrogenase large subunit [Bathymodiolus thermophilus thioautotrophic gill symbiont]|uniref:Hydrogenase large subunit n=1 Tax=Bathymodiolus thermophilus thioautotrophic gill symbiont TaxID=2360 RepID=A0A3G3IPP7_9GAMM|nr:nickel-dependent hydrogenase large subunit [Bathymodiolus thermophilus thioautotrophic gill symbiont]AYQ57669.1 hydrogenase large subunit [Bathymodiolus thermophilus thioautotrophic gill symbiont]